MATMVIRNLPEETHRALKALAAQHKCSTEAEVRAILETVVRPKSRIQLGSLLTKIGHEVGGVELAIERDKTNTEPESFK